MSQEHQSADQMGCHALQEALLLGLCIPCFGAGETAVYNHIMARLEHREQASCTDEHVRLHGQ